MKKYLYIATAVMMLSACGKEDLAPKPMETIETTAIETRVEETTIAETEEAIEETEEEVATPDLEYVDGVLVIPTEFPTFEDGKPHRLYFYADEKGMTKDTFINISLPEHGIASVSFPVRFIEDTPEDLQIIGTEGITLHTEEDRELVWDYASSPTTYLPEGSYARISIAHGLVGIVDCEGTIAGDTPTLDELKKVASVYNLGITEPIFQDTSKDGSTVFTVYCATPAPINPDIDKENFNYFGAMSVRFKDGKAQGTYYCHYDKLSEAQKYASYTVQSLRFAN